MNIIYLKVLNNFFELGLINDDSIEGNPLSVKFTVKGLVNEDQENYIVKLYRSVANNSEGITILLPGDPKDADYITLPQDKDEFHSNAGIGHRIQITNKIPKIMVNTHLFLFYIYNGYGITSFAYILTVLILNLEINSCFNKIGISCLFAAFNLELLELLSLVTT